MVDDHADVKLPLLRPRDLKVVGDNHDCPLVLALEEEDKDSLLPHHTRPPDGAALEGHKLETHNPGKALPACLHTDGLVVPGGSHEVSPNVAVKLVLHPGPPAQVLLAPRLHLLRPEEEATVVDGKFPLEHDRARHLKPQDHLCQPVLAGVGTVDHNVIVRLLPQHTSPPDEGGNKNGNASETQVLIKYLHSGLVVEDVLLHATDLKVPHVHGILLEGSPCEPHLSPGPLHVALGLPHHARPPDGELCHAGREGATQGRGTGGTGGHKPGRKLIK